MATEATTDIALSVHGPVGVLDLVVPSGAVAADVAEEYARLSGLDKIPALCTSLGGALRPDQPLDEAGVRAGDVLVATMSSVPATRRSAGRRSRIVPPPRRAGAAAPVLATIGAACALGGGWAAATAETGPVRTAALGVLLLGALIGILPVGRYAAARATAAPAFAGALALAAAWEPHEERLPMMLGLCALAAALAAALARALGRAADEALQVWIVAGVVVFLVTGLGTLAGAPPRLTWSLLLVLAVFGARVVPGLVVDVPDQYLLDLERLAVTAWSARERRGGKRGRSVVPMATVTEVAARGTRLVTAAAAAIAVVAIVSAPLLLATATVRVDRIGARCLVGFAGAALLLAARSYRHRGARALLRVGGLGAWVALLVVAAGLLGERGRWTLVVSAVVLGLVLVVAAVATGRGWRSAWWSRRAEVAEGLCGAFVIASVVVSSGWFRSLWEATSLWELSR